MTVAGGRRDAVTRTGTLRKPHPPDNPVTNRTVSRMIFASSSVHPRRKIRYDLLYVRRGCTLLDAKIILDTVLLVTGLSGGCGLRRVPVRVTASRRPLATVIPIRFDHTA